MFYFMRIFRELIMCFPVTEQYNLLPLSIYFCPYEGRTSSLSEGYVPPLFGPS